MIEAVSKNNLAEVLPLIRAYQEFYKVSMIEIRSFLASLVNLALLVVSSFIERQAMLLGSLQFTFRSQHQSQQKLLFSMTFILCQIVAVKVSVASLSSTVEAMRQKMERLVYSG